MNRRRQRRIGSVLACVACVASLGVACSPGPVQDAEPDRPTQTTDPRPPNPADLEATVRDYARAYTAGDVDAVVPFRSLECRTTDLQALEQDVELATTLYPGASLLTFRAELSGEEFASVSYTFTRPELNIESQSWIVEEFEWRNNSC